MFWWIYLGIGLYAGFRTTKIVFDSFEFTPREIEDDRVMFMGLVMLSLLAGVFSVVAWPLALAVAILAKIFEQRVKA
jgi:hypothetical protein